MESEKASDKINYLRFATAILFLHAAGGLYGNRRNGVSPVKTMEAIPVSEIAQDEMMAIHEDYEGSCKL